MSKSPLAQARDAWFESDEGKGCTNCQSLNIDPQQYRYLRNRLERAFLAGAAAQERIMMSCQGGTDEG